MKCRKKHLLHLNVGTIDTTRFLLEWIENPYIKLGRRLKEGETEVMLSRISIP